MGALKLPWSQPLAPVSKVSVNDDTPALATPAAIIIALMVMVFISISSGSPAHKRGVGFGLAGAEGRQEL